MAKSDSFFIRADLLVDDTGSFQQTEIDLGAYVDALGQAVLRIHNIEWQVTAADGTAPLMDAGESGQCLWQLTTQSKLSTGMATLVDKSVIASGQLWAHNPDGQNEAPSQVYNDTHAPQHYTNGYLVATEQVYLGGLATTPWTASSNVTIAVMLECTVEKMTKESAIALALSQQ